MVFCIVRWCDGGEGHFVGNGSILEIDDRARSLESTGEIFLLVAVQMLVQVSKLSIIQRNFEEQVGLLISQRVDRLSRMGHRS